MKTGGNDDRTTSELSRSFSTAARSYAAARTAPQAGAFAPKAPTPIRTPWLSGDELAILARRGRMTEGEVLQAVEDQELRERVAVARAFERYRADKRKRNSRLAGLIFAVFVVALIAALIWPWL